MFFDVAQSVEAMFYFYFYFVSLLKIENTIEYHCHITKIVKKNYFILSTVNSLLIKIFSSSIFELQMFRLNNIINNVVLVNLDSLFLANKAFGS